MNSAAFIQAIEQVLQRSTAMQAQKLSLQNNVSCSADTMMARLLAKLDGRSMGGLVGFTDYYFFVDCDALPAAQVAEKLQNFHEAARRFANAEFRTPRGFRMKIPNIVTVGISAQPFSEDAIAHVEQKTFAPGAGEAQQMMLLDLPQEQIFCQGRNRVRGRWHVAGGSNFGGVLSFEFKHLDPINRANSFVQQTAQAAGASLFNQS